LIIMNQWLDKYLHSGLGVTPALQTLPPML